MGVVHDQAIDISFQVFDSVSYGLHAFWMPECLQVKCSAVVVGFQAEV